MSFYFMSYDDQDAYFAENILLPKLTQQTPFDFKTRGDALRDPNMTNGINSAINRSHAVILIVSEVAMKSITVKFEWGYAHYINKPIIPVMIEAPEVIGSDGRLEVVYDVHTKLARETWYNFSDDAHYEWEKLHDKLNKVAFTQKDPTSTVTMPLRALDF